MARLVATMATAQAATYQTAISPTDAWAEISNAAATIDCRTAKTARTAANSRSPLAALSAWLLASGTIPRRSDQKIGALIRNRTNGYASPARMAFPTAVGAKNLSG